MAGFNFVEIDRPQRKDLDRCVHCGLCLNACPTYRELGIEMDSPRGRIYQMDQVARGLAQISPSYIEHLELCLACRGCESACPSGVQYGRLIESARADIQNRTRRSIPARLLRWLVFERLLPSRKALEWAARAMWLVRKSGIKAPGKLGRLQKLSPEIQYPSFFDQYGKIFPSDGPREHRVALLGGCIANVSFARLNEATVRVLQKNGCEVTVPADQTCCGALHVHAGIRSQARALATQNIDALLAGNFDAIITNAAGCGSTLKEYHELFEHDPAYAEKSRKFSALVKDVNEFLASIELNTKGLREISITVTYQDSCHLAHGQKIRAQPRKLLRAIPGLILKEMVSPDLCCGSAGIYNVVHNDMAMAILEKKMESVNLTNAETIVTANPGCMIQLQAGAAMHGKGQAVKHVVEILDEAYR